MKLRDGVRIILMANDIVGLNTVKYLVDRGENLVALFVHDVPNQKYTHEIIDASNLSEDNVYMASALKSGSIRSVISSYRPDVIITCYWAHLLTPEVFNIPTSGCINFHPALLPYNRGWYPSIWPFIDGTPCGVTLNYIDEGADTGSIIAQRVVGIAEEDTAGTVYDKCKQVIFDLFKDAWVKLKGDGIMLSPQNHSVATYHSKKDGNELNKIYLESKYKVKDLFNLLKARTFGDRSFAYYEKDGNRYSVRIIIEKI